MTVNLTEVYASVRDHARFSQDEFGVSRPDQPTKLIFTADIVDLTLGKVSIHPTLKPDRKHRTGFHVDQKVANLDEIIAEPRRKPRKDLI